MNTISNYDILCSLLSGISIDHDSQIITIDQWGIKENNLERGNDYLKKLDINSCFNKSPININNILSSVKKRQVETKCLSDYIKPIYNIEVALETICDLLNIKKDISRFDLMKDIFKFIKEKFNSIDENNKKILIENIDIIEKNIKFYRVKFKLNYVVGLIYETKSQVNIDFMIYYVIIIYYKLIPVPQVLIQKSINKNNSNSTLLNKINNITEHLMYGCNILIQRIGDNLEERRSSQNPNRLMSWFSSSEPIEDILFNSFQFEKVTTGGSIRHNNRSRSKSKRTKSRSRNKSKSRK
jgi:hypothetical protein